MGVLRAGSEPVEDGDTDLELCKVTVEATRGQALPMQLDAVHRGFSAASAVLRRQMVLPTHFDVRRIS
jgi:hypothetical protein